ncbi:MAG: NADH-quinone oxidoreductase subunit NuoG [Nitrospirae bacterium]|nr:NADH-quinone oxidoreductase subunit NuoG [Nitrospirota bacterium]
MIKITINGKEIQLEKPITILDAAKANGIKIPHFCHHSLLEQWGGCRMCLVEVERMPKLQTACTLYVTDGMVIRTESETISKARKSVLEFILINHPLDCPVCDKAGECKLQDYVVQYGATAGRFRETKIKHPEGLEDPIIVRNPERCIMCTRCVRMCDGVQGASAIAIINRGNHSTMEPLSGKRFDCEYCGNCLTVCPVGALMSRLHRYSYRPWQLTDEVQTICPFCGVGCSLIVQVRDQEIKRVVPKVGLGTNKGILCNRGRFGYEYVSHHERLTSPLIKKNGHHVPVSWDEALTMTAKRLGNIKDSAQGSAISGIASGRCTNEENYVFQKLLRGLGSNNIDSTSRMALAGSRRLIERLLGSGVTANVISGVTNSDAIFVAGGDPTQINPVLGIQVREAFRKGSKVLTIGHIPGLKRYNTVNLTPVPYTETLLLSGILSILIKEKGLPGKNPFLEAKLKDFNVSINELINQCKIKKDSLDAVIVSLSRAESPAIVVGRDAMQRSTDIFMLASISYLTNAKLYLMSERPNENGTLDMGCLPDALPGGIPIEMKDLKRKCEDVWDIKVPLDKGLSLMEMIEAVDKGSIKAMYVMGENPAFNLPDSSYVKNALSKLEFLVVQDIFMSETAQMADVVLPALSWAEKDGTYTNLERRIQLLRKTVHRNGMEDWMIISEVGKRLGLKMPYSSAENIMKEISEVSPLHAGLSYKDIEKGFNVWPYKGKPVEPELPELNIELTSLYEKSNGDICLMLEKPLFHSGTLTRKSPALLSIYPEAVIRVNPKTASRFKLKDGDIAKVSSDKGAIKLKVKTDRSLDENIVLLSNNFEAKGALSLVGYSLDPITRTPQIQKTIVSIEKG